MEVSYSKLLARYQSRNGSWFAVNELNDGWGVLGKTPLYLAVKVSFRVAREKYKNAYIVCVLTWSLLGVKKSFSHAQIGLL